jgi:hypothetical protein
MNDNPEKKSSPTPSKLILAKESLTKANYTSAGIKRFEQTLESFSEQLYDKSILFAEAEKQDGFDREVTEKHVRLAASILTRSLFKTEQPGWVIPVQIGEYLFTAIAGAGASNLSSNYGILFELTPILRTT